MAMRASSWGASASIGAGNLRSGRRRSDLTRFGGLGRLVAASSCVGGEELVSDLRANRRERKRANRERGEGPGGVLGVHGEDLEGTGKQRGGGTATACPPRRQQSAWLGEEDSPAPGLGHLPELGPGKVGFAPFPFFYICSVCFSPRNIAEHFIKIPKRFYKT